MTLYSTDTDIDLGTIVGQPATKGIVNLLWITTIRPRSLATQKILIVMTRFEKRRKSFVRVGLEPGGVAMIINPRCSGALILAFRAPFGRGGSVKIGLSYLISSLILWGTGEITAAQSKSATSTTLIISSGGGQVTSAPLAPFGS